MTVLWIRNIWVMDSYVLGPRAVQGQALRSISASGFHDGLLRYVPNVNPNPSSFSTMCFQTMKKSLPLQSSNSMPVGTAYWM